MAVLASFCCARTVENLTNRRELLTSLMAWLRRAWAKWAEEKFPIVTNISFKYELLAGDWRASVNWAMKCVLTACSYMNSRPRINVRPTSERVRLRWRGVIRPRSILRSIVGRNVEGPCPGRRYQAILSWLGQEDDWCRESGANTRWKVVYLPLSSDIRRRLSMSLCLGDVSVLSRRAQRLSAQPQYLLGELLLGRNDADNLKHRSVQLLRRPAGCGEENFWQTGGLTRNNHKCGTSQRNRQTDRQWG